ncbi:MAG: acylneuraminate cytidylyltransferase family protein [Opitutales bacterium]
MPKKPRTVALIPARGGSKGIPGKNLRELADRPLIAWSIGAAKLCPSIDQIIVSTDDPKIAEVSMEYGADVPFLRPKEFARDDSLDKEFFLHFYSCLKEQKVALPELVVHLRPTTPLRDTNTIEQGIQIMRESPQLSSLRSMHPIKTTPYKLFVEVDGLAQAALPYPEIEEAYNMPRQFFPAVYQPNGLVDVVRPEVLLETGKVNGDSMYLFETETCPDIDHIEDLEQASKLSMDSKYKDLREMLKSPAIN